MPGATSPWRVNDVVTYDWMRHNATALTALLIAIARAGGDEAEQARVELAEWRREVEMVDGFDRAGVIALADRIDRRIRELEGPQ
ncbi:hypothetical protein JNB63_07330 [Microbacterium trichothecenolyticum]|uniref:Uncharacterized protein n=1 Tax=Microbacterium ureisolvens TaxID=2781186 RepID=A0ABS7HVA8_9MICO|nr:MULTISPECIES: hypothetical protein [Microbacterium]MBW9108978.1 hypothetical protein [Microbacterium ureisolvens]MBW9119898.1 hypothetical protein [Microbacterium trichothecenolyticum]